MSLTELQKCRLPQHCVLRPILNSFHIYQLRQRMEFPENLFGLFEERRSDAGEYHCGEQINSSQNAEHYDVVVLKKTNACC